MGVHISVSCVYKLACPTCHTIVIGDVGPYCGPSGVAATVRVDARFQGTIVRGLGYPSCRPSPCGPRRQFDIGDSCVRSKKQLLLFVSIFLLYINNSNIYLNAGRSIQLFHLFAIARFLHGFTVTLSEPAHRVPRD